MLLNWGSAIFFKTIVFSGYMPIQLTYLAVDISWDYDSIFAREIYVGVVVNVTIVSCRWRVVDGVVPFKGESINDGILAAFLKSMLPAANCSFWMP